MKNELVSESLRDFFKNRKVDVELMNEVYTEVLKAVSHFKDTIRLSKNGLTIRTIQVAIEINKNENYVKLNNSKCYFTKEKITDLYNKVLKKSFEE